MIIVNDIVDWMDVNRLDDERLPIRRAHVFVRDLRRSVVFYTRAFGFCSVTTASNAAHRSVVMTVTPSSELVLSERTADSLLCPPQRRQWAFVVEDLELAREAVWELGVKVARDSGEPDQIYRRRGGASLYIHDPDENEIELVESSPEANFRATPARLLANASR